MFHELRLYTPSPGRLDDLVARIGFDMVPYFERHGFSRRLGQWTAVAGETTPVFVWLLQWQDMAERASAFAGLGADADWNALRTRTNGPGEMVKRYDIRFLAPAKAWLKQTSAEREPGGHRGLVELRVHPIAVGRTGPAGDVLATVDLPALAACGASLSGVFDNIAGGPATPGVTMLLGWSDYEQRCRALAAYRERPEVVAARRREREKWAGEHLLGDGGSMLLEPTRFDATVLRKE
jgi:NIPSNAP protein